MKKTVCILLFTIFLIGCDTADPDSYLDVPTVMTQDENTARPGCLLEIPQIMNTENDEAQVINTEIQELSQYLVDTYWEDEIMWCEMTAWPTETERYISITVQLDEYPAYGTEGTLFTWVYDKKKGEQVYMDDALSMAKTDMETIEADLAEWCSINSYLVPEEILSSIRFRMTVDEKPQFLAGVTMVSEALAGETDPWEYFFTWTDGVVECGYGVPFDPAEINGSYTHYLMSQIYEDSMNQYDGDPDHVSEWEAMELFEEIYEINKYLENGYEMRFDGNTVELDYETCICAVLGKEVNGEFVEKGYYAATWGCAYWYDPEGDAWVAVGFG